MDTYPLTRQHVKQHTRNHPGTYILLDPDPGDPSLLIRRYIGRSTTKLQRRLLRHVNDGRYAAFQLAHWDSIEEVFQMECLMFHHNRETLTNQRHPDAPRSLTHLRCPYCGNQSRLRLQAAAATVGVT